MKQYHGKLSWKEIKSVPVYLLTLYFLFIFITYLRQGATWSLVCLLPLFWILFTFFALFEEPRMKGFFQKHAGIIGYTVLILSPAASFLVVETMVSNFNAHMFRSYSLYNLVWYVLFYFIVFAITRSFRYTVAICNILVYIASMVNYFVYLFRGNPILPSDLLAWRTGMSVASNYEVKYTAGFLIATLIMYVSFVLGYKLEKPEKKPSAVNRMLVIASCVLLFALVYHEFFNTELISTKIKVLDFFAPKYTYCDYGTVFGFVANAQAMDTKEPDGYSTSQVKELLAGSEDEEEAVAASNTSTGQDKPNIIVIMNEAFSDLSLVGDFKTNMDYLPFIRSLKENTIKGSMFTSVFGGATSDTEYEFLTGNSMAVMPQNCVPYQQFVTKKRDSLVTTLKSQGYYSIAIHPYEPSGYKRDIVYPLLGFDEFLSRKDFIKPSYIRNFISDESSYEKIIEQYEKKGKDQPLFIFNVTMQNHGGYSGETLFEEQDNVKLTEYAGYPCVEQYLSLLRQSDKAFEKLVDYFSKQKEHTIILLFGDHQPIAYADLYNLLTLHEDRPEEDLLRRKYQVPFVLWANYDLQSEEDKKISANYLSSFLLQTAGLKGTAYNRYLMKLYEKIPVINALFYINQNNQFHSFGDQTSDTELITQYRYVGYNNALDDKNRLKAYYYLQ